MEMFEDLSAQAPKAYISLANKYRPQTFEEVVGQESVSKTLVNAIKSGRIAHAYLFYGPRGCGKTTTARLLAKALNCTGNGNNKPTASPCGQCPQCREIAASADMDVLELDAASNTQVEKIREVIIDTVALASGRDRYKVFILDEVHMLSDSSFNALLKTIEEPPAHVVFILATTELNKVPVTISSRCQTFRFKPLTEEEITNHLLDLAGAENIELEDDAAKMIAKSANGALRDALTIFDRAIAFSDGKVNSNMVREMLGALPKEVIKECVQAVINKDAENLHSVFEKIRSEGFDALGLLKDLKNAFGEIFYLSLNSGKEPFAGAKDILKECSPAYIASLTRKISKLNDEVKFSDTPALSAEVGLFTIMQNSIDIDNLVARLEALENSCTSQNSSFTEKKSLNEGVSSVPTQPEINHKKDFVLPDFETKKQNTQQINPQKSFEEIKKEIFNMPAPAMPESAKILRQQIPTPVNTNRQEQTTQEKFIDFSSALEVWPSFKQELNENYPFLYEGIMSAAPSFISKTEWEFSFKERDSFFKDTLQRRMSDLEKAALKICGKKIKFTFKVVKSKSAPTPAEKTLQGNAKVSYISKPDKQTGNTLSKPEEKSCREQDIISSEEPFAEGDFSSFVNNENKKEFIAERLKDVGPKTREVLDIFDGDIVE